MAQSPPLRDVRGMFFHDDADYIMYRQRLFSEMVDGFVCHQEKGADGGI